jgi:hypothetical protein
MHPKHFHRVDSHPQHADVENRPGLLTVHASSINRLLHRLACRSLVGLLQLRTQSVS